MDKPDDTGEHDDDRLDLSALDPSRDQLRWERTIAAVTARAVRRRAASLPLQLLAWARPALAAAAALVLVVWAAALLRGHHHAPARETPGFALSRWAEAGEVPSTAQLLQTLGGVDGAR